MAVSPVIDAADQQLFGDFVVFFFSEITEIPVKHNFLMHFDILCKICSKKKLLKKKPTLETNFSHHSLEISYCYLVHFNQLYHFYTWAFILDLLEEISNKVKCMLAIWVIGFKIITLAWFFWGANHCLKVKWISQFALLKFTWINYLVY